MDDISIIDTNIENVTQFGLCGYKNIKKPGFPDKYEWLKKRFPEGLIIKTLYSEKDGTQGMIEYIPGEYCWRPVELLVTCLSIVCLSVLKTFTKTRVMRHI